MKLFRESRIFLFVALALVATGLSVYLLESWHAYEAGLSLARLECSIPRTSGGRVFHVDPVNGATDGDGSAARPWRQLQDVLDAGLVARGTRHLSTSDLVRSKIFGTAVAPYLKDNPHSVVTGGDTLLLHPGNYGDIRIKNLANHTFVRIVGLVPEKALLNSLRIEGASHFLIENVTVMRDSTSEDVNYLVNLKFRSQHLLNDNIVLRRLVVGSGLPVGSVDVDKRPTELVSGVLLNGRCVAMDHSLIHDIRFGVALYKVEGARLIHNRITDFTVDGIDFSGNDVVIDDNVIANHWAAGDRLHPDCMQGQSGDERPTYSHIRITRNLCIADAGTSDGASSYMQGISIFDGRWRDVIVRCNIVLPSSQHGIALYGIDDAVISHNVVIGKPDGKLSWIVAFPAKNGRPPSGNTISGNLSAGYLNAAAGARGIRAVSPNEIRVGQDMKIRKILRNGFSGVEMRDNLWAVDPIDPIRLERSEIFQKVPLDRGIGRTSVRDAQEFYLKATGCRA